MYRGSLCIGGVMGGLSYQICWTPDKCPHRSSDCPCGHIAPRLLGQPHVFGVRIEVEADSVHHSLVQKSGRQSLLQSPHSVRLTHGHHGLHHPPVVPCVRPSGPQLPLQLQPRLYHFQGIGENARHAARRGPQHEVHRRGDVHGRGGRRGGHASVRFHKTPNINTRARDNIPSDGEERVTADTRRYNRSALDDRSPGSAPSPRSPSTGGKLDVLEPSAVCWEVSHAAGPPLTNLYSGPVPPRRSPTNLCPRHSSHLQSHGEGCRRSAAQSDRHMWGKGHRRP